jgi:FlaA1/EpsC-like NDP-sugar epimerase
VIFEQSEAALFVIHQELIRKYPRLDIVPSVGDIKEYSVVTKVIRTHRIESIFHAAAYKHVPMMEMHLLEAVKNNVLGTGNVARAAYYNQVSQFLMISSDKAVNPTNIMGLTKRVAELIVTAMPLPAEGGATKFCSVRFGNVLGSSGSVVPMFEQQIAAGGPVTVTHPEMRRFFMTVREAVQLVLQASTMGKGSEVFVLDMGEPVKIVELARNMIRLAGREPDVDVEIRFVGIRPGEKLYEEVLVGGENIMPTYHKKIRIFSGARKSANVMENWLSKLEKLIADEDEAGIVTALSQLVPEYQPSAQWADLIQPVRQLSAPVALKASAAGIQ